MLSKTQDRLLGALLLLVLGSVIIWMFVLGHLAIRMPTEGADVMADVMAPPTLGFVIALERTSDSLYTDAAYQAAVRGYQKAIGMLDALEAFDRGSFSPDATVLLAYEVRRPVLVVKLRIAELAEQLGQAGDGPESGVGR